MELFSNLFLIGFLCVFVIDYSGFIEEMDNLLTKVLKSRVPLHIPKPFSCSLCMTWWTGLIYLLISHSLSLPYLVFLASICIFTPEILSIIYFVKDLINKLFDSIERILGMTE